VNIRLNYVSLPGDIVKGSMVLLTLYLLMMTGCGQVEKYTNDPPEITNFAVPKEVAYGETVEFRVRVFDPEDDAITYAWDVTAGDLLSETGAVVQWTAPALPAERVVSPMAVNVHVYIRDGISEENVSKSASVIVFSKAFKIAKSFSGVYELIRYEVHQDPVRATGTMTLTPTTFTRQHNLQEGSDVFISGSFELVEPFDERKGTINWFSDTTAATTTSTYTWDGRLLIFVWKNSTITAVYQKVQ